MSLAELRDSKLLPIALVVALLWCHGTFGVVHQVLPTPVAEHPSPTGQGPVPGQHPVGGPGDSDCTAALAVGVFGAALSLLLSSIWAWRRSCASPLATLGLPKALPALPMTRGALSPFQQVLRL